MLHCLHGASTAAPNHTVLLGEHKRTCFGLLHYAEGTSDSEALKGAFVDRRPPTLAESFKDLTNKGCQDIDLVVRKTDRVEPGTIIWTISLPQPG